MEEKTKDKETSILNRIEESREKLHNMINFDKNIIFDDVTIKTSQYLDKLIIEYIKCSKKKRSTEKD